MEHNLDSAINTQYGGANFAKSPISFVMDSNPLIVDYYTAINEVARRAMSRKKNNIYDHIIITYNNMYLGIIPVSSLLSYINMQVCNQAI
ncbi:CBS domain-containing protein [Clostridium chromiireducens]